MYKIIGGDGKEYGPVPMDKVSEWIREGRADGNSLIQPPGHAEWRRLSEVPELQFSVPANPGMYPLVYPLRRPTNTMAGVVLNLANCYAWWVWHDQVSACRKSTGTQWKKAKVWQSRGS